MEWSQHRAQTGLSHQPLIFFGKCGTCSQTFAYLLNRSSGQCDPLHEQAVDPLAGGIFRQGHQCGMLWGAALATRAEAFRRTEDVKEAQSMALAAAKELVASFENQEHTIECRAITGVRMDRFTGLLKFMLQHLLTDMDKSKCFEMAEEWAPKAVQAGESGLHKRKEGTPPAHNCAAEVARAMGATEQ